MEKHNDDELDINLTKQSEFIHGVLDTVILEFTSDKRKINNYTLLCFLATINISILIKLYSYDFQRVSLEIEKLDEVSKKMFNYFMELLHSVNDDTYADLNFSQGPSSLSDDQVDELVKQFKNDPKPPV